MKKTFTLTHEKIKPARLAEAARRDVRRYFKRSRKRELAEGVDFWDFDCKFGLTAAEAQVIDEGDLLKAMVDAEAKGVESFYVEILAKEGHKPNKPTPPPAEQEEEAPPPTKPNSEE